MGTLFQDKKKLMQLVISGMTAILLVKFFIGNKARSIEDRFAMTTVLVAAQDIAPKTQLRPSMLTTMQVPRQYMQPDAIMVKIPEDVYKRVDKKVCTIAIPEGGQITFSNLQAPSMEGTGVAPIIQPGKRGYLLRLGNLDVARLILPGDNIDIMATLTVRDKDGNTFKQTRVILQNIYVVSVGKTIIKPVEEVTEKKVGEEGLVLTLAVDLMEAARLAQAVSDSGGDISVVVRPRSEQGTQNTTVVNSADLLSSPTPGEEPNQDGMEQKQQTKKKKK